MSDVKIYTVMSDELSPPITGEAFCTDMVRASDYAALEQQLAAVVAENAGLKGFGKTLSEMHEGLNGSGTGIQGEYEATCQQVALDAAMDAFDEIKTPATEAFLAEARAQESKRVYESILDNPAVTDMESLVDWLEQNANDSVAFAAQLRKGVQS